jgi:hypothetical protein
MPMQFVPRVVALGEFAGVVCSKVHCIVVRVSVSKSWKNC